MVKLPDLPLHELRRDGAEVGGAEFGCGQSCAGVAEIRGETKLHGATARVGKPDPAGLFAIGIEAGDDRGAEIDGDGRVRFGVERDTDDSVARAYGGGCDEGSVGCEIDGLGTQLAGEVAG